MRNNREYWRCVHRMKFPYNSVETSQSRQILESLVYRFLASRIELESWCNLRYSIIATWLFRSASHLPRFRCWLGHNKRPNNRSSKISLRLPCHLETFHFPLTTIWVTCGYSSGLNALRGSLSVHNILGNFYSDPETSFFCSTLINELFERVKLSLSVDQTFVSYRGDNLSPAGLWARDWNQPKLLLKFFNFFYVLKDRSARTNHKRKKKADSSSKTLEMNKQKKASQELNSAWVIWPPRGNPGLKWRFKDYSLLTFMICKDMGKPLDFFMILRSFPRVFVVITFPLISSRTSPTSILS